MLSEEESKAIKILLEFRDYYAREDINRENFNNEENYKKALNGIKILKNSFDTVINLVTRLQKENKELKHDNRILLDEEKNYIYTEHVHNNQIQQLKKQIDLMGEYIARLDIDQDICIKVEDSCFDYAGQNGKTCEECIKQYFERKVKK